MKVANRFKELDLVDRVPEKLWTEVRDIVQEVVIKTILKKKKCKKAKWLSEEALQIAEKRQEAKGEGERERYIYLNAEFQRIARRDKKAVLSDQCKEVGENNRTGKDQQQQGNVSCKDGSIKDRNGIYLQKQRVLRRDDNNTQKNYMKNILIPG